MLAKDKAKLTISDDAIPIMNLKKYESYILNVNHWHYQ